MVPIHSPGSLSKKEVGAAEEERKGNSLFTYHLQTIFNISSKKGCVIIPVLYLRRLRLTEVKYFAQNSWGKFPDVCLCLFSPVCTQIYSGETSQLVLCLCVGGHAPRHR